MINIRKIGIRKAILLATLLTLCIPANAYDSYYVPQQVPNPVFEFNVYPVGEGIIADDEVMKSTFTIPQTYIEPLLLSAQNWNERINESPIAPVVYGYISADEYNAMAGSPYVKVAELPNKVTLANAKLHNWTITTPSKELDLFGADSMVEIGLGISEKFPGWQLYTGKHALYHNELPDLYAVMAHEMMHSLGVTSAVEKYREDVGDNTYYFSENNTDPLSMYDSQLRIYTGSTDPVTNPANEIAPAPGQAVGPTGYDVIRYSPYFVGQNVIKVLGGDADYDTARQKIIDSGGMVNYSDYYLDSEKPYPVVYGLPIHPSDGPDEDGIMEYDLSHIELRNSYMSHQEFRNWLVPMEAELALMNDIGYNIDLRKYFGKSYYLNNQVDTYTVGFSDWNGAAYTANPSRINQAVGIHIYGNNNTITQTTNDISLLGEGSIGVRVDGVGNTYNLNSGNIYANGKENIGIAVTWGHGHNVNVAGGTNVVASGEDGIAISFDYGSNLFGTLGSDIKGSYINYRTYEDLGFNVEPDNENKGPLVTNLNVNGTLQGEKAAIYISDNAYVKNINVNNGAQIKGDIISEWNSIFSLNKAKVLKYDSETNYWSPIDPQKTSEFYYTNLNFNAPGGVTVEGDITGANKIFNTLKMQNNVMSVVNFNGNKIIVNALDNKGEINLSKNVEMSVTRGKITGDGDINILNGAGLNLSGNIYNIANNLNFNNASFNIANNAINEIQVSGMALNGKNNLALDVDLDSMSADKFIFNNSNDLIVNNSAGFKINDVNLMNSDKIFTERKYYIPFISSDYKNQNLLGKIDFNASADILTPIFKYKLGYEEDAANGGFSFARGTTKKYENYNPAAAVSPIAAQFGGYLSQLNSYDQAFHNVDMKMLMTREERQAYKFANRYASTTQPQVFSPVYLPEKDKAGWFRPYATFEKVGLSNGPKVENVTYGSFFGGDSQMFETKNGWDYQYSAYVGYNGSHQNYQGNSIYQNGGTLGATGIWYKDNFFTALTANVGASVADARTMYGSEDFPMLMAGIASKTGYNWELARGKFIVQPSYLMSYTFVNTFDYTNAAGIRIKSDPLNAINIAPGLKFIGNLKHGWQPYVGVQMVWNIMDKTDFKANDVALPDMSVKPYFQYGIGVQKRWGERFTGFFQTMIRNGGRNGIALSAGFRWAIGK